MLRVFLGIVVLVMIGYGLYFMIKLQRKLDADNAAELDSNDDLTNGDCPEPPYDFLDPTSYITEEAWVTLKGPKGKIRVATNTWNANTYHLHGIKAFKHCGKETHMKGKDFRVDYGHGTQDLDFDSLLFDYFLLDEIGDILMDEMISEADVSTADFLEDGTYEEVDATDGEEDEFETDLENEFKVDRDFVRVEEPSHDVDEPVFRETPAFEPEPAIDSACNDFDSGDFGSDCGGCDD